MSNGKWPGQQLRVWKEKDWEIRDKKVWHKGTWIDMRGRTKWEYLFIMLAPS